MKSPLTTMLDIKISYLVFISHIMCRKHRNIIIAQTKHFLRSELIKDNSYNSYVYKYTINPSNHPTPYVRPQLLFNQIKNLFDVITFNCKRFLFPKREKKPSSRKIS